MNGDVIELMAEPRGYFTGVGRITAGDDYWIVTGKGHRRPDPASRYQPEGVHGPSRVVDPSFNWTDHDWHGVPQRDYVIYELHIGTFTRAGTFDAAIDRLDYLKDLGITAIEVMPVAQFPGTRNWGYDGVLPYAVQNSYGGPQGLKRLVDAAHARGIAVVLDVVYNHLGPEGNYAGEFAPYFTQKYKTPWGPSVNVDGPHNDGVREYFAQNALEWITDYHIDGLRFDAVHGILDTSAHPFLAELTDALHERAGSLDREVVVIAESDLNDVRMIQPTAKGGFGMDAQWTDDFHHSLHALLTKEQSGYYQDFGTVHDFATSLRQGYVFTGQYSEFRKCRHGNHPMGARPEQFVICIQNHDQIGNRMLGERLASLVDFERQKLAAACVLLSPFMPLMFMGDEYGETKPFHYFIDHSDEALIESVRRGRKEEFASFKWRGEPADPKAVETFEAAILDGPRDNPESKALTRLYKELTRLRENRQIKRDVLEVENAIVINQVGSTTIFSFSESTQRVAIPLPRGDWHKRLCTAGSEWLGPGEALPGDVASPGSVCLEVPPLSATLYVSASNE